MDLAQQAVMTAGAIPVDTPPVPQQPSIGDQINRSFVAAEILALGLVGSVSKGDFTAWKAQPEVPTVTLGIPLVAGAVAKHMGASWLASIGLGVAVFPLALVGMAWWMLGHPQPAPISSGS